MYAAEYFNVSCETEVMDKKNIIQITFYHHLCDFFVRKPLPLTTKLESVHP